MKSKLPWKELFRILNLPAHTVKFSTLCFVYIVQCCILMKLVTCKIFLFIFRQTRLFHQGNPCSMMIGSVMMMMTIGPLLPRILQIYGPYLNCMSSRYVVKT